MIFTDLLTGVFNKQRDPNRITEILLKVSNIWRKYPDLRFGQLISLIKGHHNASSEAPTDLFNIEDPDFLKALRAFENSLKDL